MIGKRALALLLTATLLTTAGCSIIADTDQTDLGSSIPGETDNDTPDGSSGKDLPDLVPPSDPLAYFGQTMDQIRESLGEPGDRGLYEGAEYFSYNDSEIALFFWAKPDEDTIVRSIHLSRGAEAAGIKVGMTFAEIKAVLGAPISEGYSEYDEAYSLVCDYEQFRFFFVADSIDGPTTSVRVKYIIDT